MSRTAAFWILVAVSAFGALATINGVGKQREPIKPNVAAFATLINSFMLYCLWVLWKG